MPEKMSWKLSSIHPGIYWNILEFHFFIAVRTLLAKTRLASSSYSIRFLASQHFNTDNSLHQCRAFILFLDVSTMRTFVYQSGIAIPCAADKRGSRSTPNAYVAAVVTPILRHLHDLKGDETMHYDQGLKFVVFW